VRNGVIEKITAIDSSFGDPAKPNAYPRSPASTVTVDAARAPLAPDNHEFSPRARYRRGRAKE
jgi:hypothetical protein